jgi:hypothetical protein
MAEDAKNKTFLLKEFTKSDLKNVQIADPMGCTLEVFKKCFKEIKAACERLIEHEFITGKPMPPRPTAKKPVKSAAKKAAGKPAPKSTAKATPAAKPKKAAGEHAAVPAKAVAKSKAVAASATKAKGTRE